MRFAWDRRKAAENVRKHRLDFRRARRVFEDAHMLLEIDAASSFGEYRWTGIGEVDGDVILVVVTWPEPDDDEFVRIISARKATRGEAQRYWSSRLR